MSLFILKQYLSSTRQSTAVPEDTVDEMLRDQSNIGTTLNSTNGLHRSNNTKDQVKVSEIMLGEYLRNDADTLRWNARTRPSTK